MHITISIAFFVLTIHRGDTCIALGCLGMGCFSPPPCLFGMCMHTPPMPPMCPCQAGFHCTAGGCIMARAKGAKTFNDEAANQERVVIQEPDEQFLTCCKLLDVPTTCQTLCSFEGYNKPAVQSSLFLSSSCPISALQQIHFCAARGKDHTQCCRAAGVPTDCNVFCDQQPNKTSPLSFSHIRCLDNFDTIHDCMLEFALTEYYQMKEAAITNLRL
uniref:DB domain-containing protein n=1 Tax=Heterorhabditis bacteriophora TaxID=37862 RepID=A0A1I7XLV6_HETBA